jgi:enoyl-CoA hydratase/carnithine racemase
VPDAVVVRRHDHRVDVVIGSGVRGNALSTLGWASLERVFRTIADDPDTHVVVVTGAGRTFSSGSDLREWVSAAPGDVQAGFVVMEAAFTAIEQCPIPVVAAVDGVAAGAGCQLALACDLQILSSSARIGMPTARLGILISPSFAARISVLAGPAVTRDLLYTGRLIGAEEAVRVGLATRSAPDSVFASALDELVGMITRQPVAANQATKRAVGVALAPIRTAARVAAAGLPIEFDSFRAGVNGFLAGNRHGSNQD